MKSSGFTLIEVMIVMAIISILAAIALPSYREYIIKSRRTDATTQLVQLQMAEEKYRGNSQSYASLGQLALTPASAFYAFSITADTDDYTLVARAIGEQAIDTPCSTFTIAQTATGTAYAPAGCWK